jgi:DNA-binding MarR family transcriptional regulator
MKNNSQPIETLVTKVIDKFWETIPPVWGRIRGNVRGIAMENYNLTVEQFHILRHIYKGSHSASEIADAQQISRSAISQALDLLVEKKLVTRCEQAADRRYVQLELTESGNAMIKAIFKNNRAWMTERMSELNPEELNNVLNAMEILKKTFDPLVDKQ